MRLGANVSQDEKSQPDKNVFLTLPLIGREASRNSPVGPANDDERALMIGCDHRCYISLLGGFLALANAVRPLRSSIT